MEFSIVKSDLTSQEVHSPGDLREYTRRVEQDCRTLFKNLNWTDCPTCGAKAGGASWQKFGLTYTTCSSCRTIFASQRPNEATIAEFYRNSASRVFWNENIWRHSEDSRIQKVIRPFLEWAEGSLTSKSKVGEYRAAHSGLANEASRRFKEFASFESYTHAANPIPLPKGALDGVFLVDVFDRSERPADILSAVHASLSKEGLVFATATLSTGFDVLVMGQNHTGVFPPDRLNMLSFEGAVQLFERSGFEIVEFSTPGALDVSSLQAQIPQDHWLHYWLKDRDDENLRSDLQNFLQAHRLSSKARIQLKKRES